MDNILILPSSETEKNLLYELLNKMKVRFQTINSDVVTLSGEEISDIEEGFEDFEKGRTLSSGEVRKMMSECLK